jgi:hypothetical protein
VTTTQKPISDVLRGVNVRFSCEYTDSNPCMDDSNNMDHWKCKIRCGSHAMTLVFSKGSGHNGAKPTLEEVLDCLASDGAGYENARSFEEWASEYGYDTDSRKAERTYKAIAKQAEALKRVLGEELYKALLWDTERL